MSFAITYCFYLLSTIFFSLLAFSPQLLTVFLPNDLNGAYNDLNITADYLPYFFSQYKYTSSRSGVPKARVNPSGHSSCTMR